VEKIEEEEENSGKCAMSTVSTKIKQQDHEAWHILLAKSFEGLLNRLSESLFCFCKCHMKNAFALQMPALCMAIPPSYPLYLTPSPLLLRGCEAPLGWEHAALVALHEISI